MELVRIPAGRFVMGGDAGCLDERPATAVEIPKPFWIGQFEVTNAQFARFDPAHDSRVESRHAMQFGVRGFYVNGPRQPVVRVSWREAMAFCRGCPSRRAAVFTLPTEAEWEYACRAGTETPFSYGDSSADFSRHANLADRTLREFVCDPYDKARSPFPDPGKYDDWIPRDDRFDDGGFVSEEVGRWEPNAWGLADMHGNVAEWTPVGDAGRIPTRPTTVATIRPGPPTASSAAARGEIVPIVPMPPTAWPTAITSGSTTSGFASRSQASKDGRINSCRIVASPILSPLIFPSLSESYISTAWDPANERVDGRRVQSAGLPRPS